MIQSDFHLHSDFCDGKHTLAEMAKAAIANGMKQIGFSSHFPLKYKNDWTMDEDQLSDYILAVGAIKTEYAAQCQCYVGTEVDFYLDAMDFSDLAKSQLHHFDYTIGSIHTMGCLADGSTADIDYTPEIFEKGLRELYDNDCRKLVENYYDGIAQMATHLSPTMIGHLDIIKKNNINGHYYDPESDWYKKAWRECLAQIRKTDVIVEVNTGGLARYGDAFLYPSVEILKTVCELGIPITINSDAHCTAHIGYAFDKIERMLIEIGFKNYYVLKDNVIKDVAFNL